MTTILVSALLASAPAHACSRSTYVSVTAWVPCTTPAGGCTFGTGDHFVGRPPVADPQQRTHLVVYLPGGGSGPRQSEAFLRTAVKYGFHTIGLSYDTVHYQETDPCKNMPAPDVADAQACYAEIRDAFAFGIHDATPYFVVQPEDNVQARLASLLAYADTADPNGNWGAYLDVNGDPDWSQIIIAGWSFGAGIGQHIATTHEVQAMVMIDGVKDPHDVTSGLGAIAPLVPGLTPGCRFWGVYDANGLNPQNLLAQWSNLGMLDADSGGFQPAPVAGLESGEMLDGTPTNTWGLAGPDDRRFFTFHSCCSTPGTCIDTTLHSTFTVQADTFTDIANCTKYVAPGAEYHLRGVYEGILCQADVEACTNAYPDALPSP